MKGRVERFQEVDILLVYPPETFSFNPYISIPVLTSYLRSRGVAVEAYDANQAFLRRVLHHSHLRAGMEYVADRFLELNSKSGLTYSQMWEYYKLVKLLFGMHRTQHELAWLGFPLADYSDFQKSAEKKTAIQLIASPYFPELMLDEALVANDSRFNPFSSHHILESLAHSNFFKGLYPDIAGEVLAERSPRIVGFSIVFPGQILPAFHMAAAIKRSQPNIHITMGGPCISLHCRYLKEPRLFEAVDSLVLDEGEIPLEKLLQELSQQKPDWSLVPGLIYLENGAVRTNPPAPPLGLENSPPPDYSIFDLDQYPETREHLIVPFRLSKGCYWRKCTFCRTEMFSIRHYQQPEPELIYDQLKQVVDGTGLTNFVFSDESSRPSVLESLSRRMIADRLGVKWAAHTRVHESLTRERCQLFGEAGCQNISLGIESLSDRVLQLMRKGTSVGLIESVLCNIDGKLPLGAYMIIGFPSETEEEAHRSFAQLQSMVESGWLKDYYYSFFHLAPGSHVWQHPELYGIERMDADPKLDLDPELMYFPGSGMPRWQAFLAYGTITSKRCFFVREASFPSHVPVKGDITELRFDLAAILSRIYMNYDFSAATYAELFSAMDDRMNPLRTNESNGAS
jgi:anaerobic magnesium-protoporphyrin IX monomethyl ester cyclase